MDDRTASRIAAAPPHGGISLAAVLTETVLVQALGTMSVLIVPALAPAVAASLGVPTLFIGYQITLIYVAAMAASLVAGTLVARHGGCRIGQLAMLLDAIGCGLMSLGRLTPMIAGSIFIGTAYGLIIPASSELLIRHAPPHRRSLIFSIKQAGVPVGGMAAGIIGPWIALPFGWHAALWAVGAACLTVMAWSQRSRRELDRPETRTRVPVLLPWTSLRLVFGNPPLRWLALSTFWFSAVQLSVVAFLVALLVEERQVTLATAGLVLAGVQLSGAFGRVLWGAVADATGRGLGVLVALALAMMAAALAVTAAGSVLPLAALIALFLLLGLTANSWNGVYLSEVARLSPGHAVGSVTGAAMFFTFTGVAVGPSLFSQFHDVFGSYQATYVVIAAFSALAALMLMQVRRLVAARRATGP